jgi:hypothetical protein
VSDQRIDNLMYYVSLALCVVVLVAVTLAIFGNHVAPDRCNEVTGNCFELFSDLGEEQQMQRSESAQ